MMKDEILLSEWIHSNFCVEERDKCYKHLAHKIIKEYSLIDGMPWKRWPGSHKHVYNWVVLHGGYAVGFNENPSKGWSYPVIKYGNN